VRPRQYTGVVRAVSLVLLGGVVCYSATPDDALKRLALEADRFAEAAPGWVATESLRQTAPTGTREVVSEYGFMTLPSGTREVRRVLSVNGKNVKSSKKLDSLALAMASDNDADRRKLLEAFEKHGLHGVATDFGQLIMLFAHGNMQKFEFSGAQHVTLTKQAYLLFRFQQLDGTESLTIYEGDKPVKQKLRGQLWARDEDGLPVRIALDSEHEEKGVQVRDIGTVDYQPSSGGFLLPTVVVHKQFRDARLYVEDTFRYSDYREVEPSASKK
jgi:hypothetical protein